MRGTYVENNTWGSTSTQVRTRNSGEYTDNRQQTATDSRGTWPTILSMFSKKRRFALALFPFFISPSLLFRRFFCSLFRAGFFFRSFLEFVLRRCGVGATVAQPPSPTFHYTTKYHRYRTDAQTRQQQQQKHKTPGTFDTTTAAAAVVAVGHRPEHSSSSSSTQHTTDTHNKKTGLQQAAVSSRKGHHRQTTVSCPWCAQQRAWRVGQRPCGRASR